MQVVSALGSGIVRLFSFIDEKLEESKVFSVLLPEAIPKEVFDEKTGTMSKQCMSVGAAGFLVVLFPHPAWPLVDRAIVVGKGGAQPQTVC